MGMNDDLAPIERLKHQPMEEKAQTRPNISVVQRHVIVLEEILIRMRSKAMMIVSFEKHLGQIASILGINVVVRTQHQFDEGQQTQMFIIEVIRFWHMMPLWNSLSHGLRNESAVRDKKAQEYISSCLRATFIMLSPGYKTVPQAKLAHIVLKAGQGFNA